MLSLGNLSMQLAGNPLAAMATAFAGGVLTSLTPCLYPNVPPYVIFSDSTLMDLATYLPLAKDDLGKISGFGAFKIEKYGQQFLSLVQEYCNTQNLETRIALKQPKRERKQTSMPDEKPATERSSETKRLTLQMYKAGKTIDQM